MATEKIAGYFEDIYNKNYSGVITDEELVEIAGKYGAEYGSAIIELERVLPRVQDLDKAIEHVMNKAKDSKYPIEDKKLVEIYNNYFKGQDRESTMYLQPQDNYTVPGPDKTRAEVKEDK